MHSFFYVNYLFINYVITVFTYGCAELGYVRLKLMDHIFVSVNLFLVFLALNLVHAEYLVDLGMKEDQPE
jgi:hypothetical protein